MDKLFKEWKKPKKIDFATQTGAPSEKSVKHKHFDDTQTTTFATDDEFKSSFSSPNQLRNSLDKYSRKKKKSPRAAHK